MEVVLFYDLVTRDGRSCVEVREVQNMGKNYYASPKSTLYSCGYDTSGKNIAITRALEFCKSLQYNIVMVQDCVRSRRSVLQ